MRKWWKYQLLMWKLHKMLRKEREVENFYNEIVGEFDDTNLRNIKAKIKKVDELWLTNNNIN